MTSDAKKTTAAAAKAPLKLSGAQLRHLRGLGHPMNAIVSVGKEGLTDALVAATDTALRDHELVKVKMQREAPVDRHDGAIELAARTGSVLAQVIGRTVLLYRRHPTKPKIALPSPTTTKKKKVGKASGRAVAKPPIEVDEVEETD